MIRSLIICCTILALYISFAAIKELDLPLLITVSEYIVETSLFITIAGFVLCLLVAMILLNLIFLIFEFPYIISKRLALRKSQRISHTLIQATSYLLANNKFKASEICKKIEDNLIRIEHKELYYLIQAESEENFEKKIDYYRYLSVSKDYNYFAVKRLASVFMHNGFYEQAGDYATQAFNINEFDSEIVEILIHCYANQKIWNKFVFMVSKLSRLDQPKLDLIAHKVSSYYLQAAKDILEKGEDHHAMNYIESSLQMNPGDVEALDFYFSLNLSLNRGSDNLEILQNAFSVNPIFELAEIYIKTSNSSPEDIFNELALLADPKKYRSLFLAIAAYLNLNERAEMLSSGKLITHYN